MAFPTVAARNSGETSTVATSHTINLPTSISANQLLILKVDYAVTGNSVDLTGSGFTAITNGAAENVAGSTHGIFTAYRWTDGTEGSTVSVATSVATRVGHQTLRITGAENPSTQAPEAAASTVANNPPDPPNLTPTGGAKDYLWIACGGQTYSDTNHQVNAAPSNYTDLTAISNASQGAGFCTGATAERQLNASSENPGVFGTVGTATTGESAMVTIAVHPSSGGGTTYEKTGIAIHGP